MKNRILSLMLALSILLPLFSLALAEETAKVALTFTNAEETIFVGKTKDIKPKLENYKQKITFAYTSEDTTVATVSKTGTVKGVTAGTTTITCVASTAAGNYEASYSLTVLKAVTSISLGKNVTMAPDTTYALTAVIKPEDATIKALAWSSSKEKVATVDENGVITAHAKGTSTIVAAATDGSKKKTEITVTVKEFDVVITSIQGADVSYTTGNGMFSIGYKSKSDVVDWQSGNGDTVHLIPLKPGIDTFTISVTNYMTRGTKRTTFSIYVTQDALTAPYYLAYQKGDHYYLINAANSTVLSFSSSDSRVFSGSYTGDLLGTDRYGRGVTVQYKDKTETEEIFFYDEGNDKVIIVENSNRDEVRYSKIDLAVAEMILKEIGYSNIW